MTRVLIGGPAFESQEISEGDVLVSIDGVALKGVCPRLHYRLLTLCPAAY